MRIGVIVLAACAAGASAQAPPDYGLDFVTVGDPRNRASTPDEQRSNYDWFPGVGAVDYEFRIMRSPMTSVQWVEFVNAYAPFWTGQPTSSNLTGTGLGAYPAPGGGYDYRVFEDEHQAVNGVSWHLAAAMCNWLHNGRVNERWAFETGAYDIVGINETDFGEWVPPASREPGARFWIPSIDEFSKAVYYDPNRYGPGQGGYWRQPDQGDEPLVVGYPEDGGETMGDPLSYPDWFGSTWPVGQYPHVRSHYGMLDVTGTRAQWLETTLPGAPQWDTWKLTMGSSSANRQLPYNTQLGHHSLGLVQSNLGLRLATVIPGAPTVGVLVCFLGVASRRRNHESGADRRRVGLDGTDR